MGYIGLVFSIVALIYVFEIQSKVKKLHKRIDELEEQIEQNK